MRVFLGLTISTCAQLIKLHTKTRHTNCFNRKLNLIAIFSFMLKSPLEGHIVYLDIFKIIKASRFNSYSMFPCRLDDEATEFLEEFLEVTKQHNSVLEAKVIFQFKLQI